MFYVIVFLFVTSVLLTQLSAGYIEKRRIFQQMNLPVQPFCFAFYLLHPFLTARVNIYRVSGLYSLPLPPLLAYVPVVLTYQQGEPMFGISFLQFAQRVRGAIPFG